MPSTWPVSSWDVGNKPDWQMQELPAPVPAFPGSSPSGSHPTIQHACLYRVSHPSLLKEINPENIEQLLKTHSYGEHLLNTCMDTRGIQTGKGSLHRFKQVFWSILLKCYFLLSTRTKIGNQVIVCVQKTHKDLSSYIKKMAFVKCCHSRVLAGSCAPKKQENIRCLADT